MNIYPQEIKDGIADIVQSCASIAYCSPATITKDICAESLVFGDKVKASSANPKQLDLYYLTSVLVSTGWNKNDDVFNASETWAARHTPEDKQFNFMHNENDIIGHITGSYVVDKDGNKLAADANNPEEFDIITEAVLYNSWTNLENRQRMEQIIAEIEQGKWFVSMECLFAGFDYALIDNAGNAKLLQRNEGSAFLTKHLRAYGGTGEYEGYRIGRSLKEISFSGKGLVSKPANPRSVILDASRAFSLNDIILTSFPKGDDAMSDLNLLEKQLAEVQSELASVKEENTTLRAKVEELSSLTEQTEAVSKLEANLAERDEVIKSLEASLAEKDTAVADLQKTLSEMEEDKKMKDKELEMMKKEKKMAKRKASLLDAGFDESEVEESMATYEALEDTVFDSLVAAMKKKMAKYKEEKPMASQKVEETKAEESDAVSEEMVAEILEEVSTSEATLVDASNDVDELLATRASVAEWLETNVLRK